MKNKIKLPVLKIPRLKLPKFFKFKGINNSLKSFIYTGITSLVVILFKEFDSRSIRNQGNSPCIIATKDNNINCTDSLILNSRCLTYDSPTNLRCLEIAILSSE